MLAGPAEQALEAGSPPRHDRLVAEEPAEVLAQLDGRLVAAGGIAIDGLVDDRHQVAGDRAIDPVQAGRLGSGHLADQPLAVGIVEGRLKRQELVERQSQRADLAAGVVLAVERLRRQVTQGPDHVAGGGQVLLARRLGQPEIGDPDVAVQVQEQVGRLDVAVQDTLLVGVLEPAATCARCARRSASKWADAPSPRGTLSR